MPILSLTYLCAVYGIIFFFSSLINCEKKKQYSFTKPCRLLYTTGSQTKTYPKGQFIVVGQLEIGIGH
jgi:hypothetical protein